MLRKNTTMFAKLQNGKYGLRVWYPNLKATKEAVAEESEDETDNDAADEEETATTKKVAAAS